MTLTEILPSLQKLSHQEKIKAIQFLATELAKNEPNQTTEESLEYGEIDTELNFQPFTELEMIQQSKSALEAYRRKGSGVKHEQVKEWANSLGSNQERPCPR
jgi:5-formyltetrahydrofolate cyclo-ligase